MASLSASGGEGFKTTCVLYTIINVDDEDVKKKLPITVENPGGR